MPKLTKVKSSSFLLSVSALLLGLLILAISVLSTIAQAEPEVNNILIPSSPQEILNENSPGGYPLVYPGMMPDNPLYFLKMFRDRLLLLTTANPLKKTELYLLFADKRLKSGEEMIKKGNYDLGIETIVKSTGYFIQAIEEIKKARLAGMIDEALVGRLRFAGLGHLELLEEITSSDSVPNEVKDPLVKSREALRAKLNELN